jgi:Tfp pilus assembly protein FimT
MKKIVYLMIALALIAVLAVPGFSARAQSATAQSWTSSITYYTPSAPLGRSQ